MATDWSPFREWLWSHVSQRLGPTVTQNDIAEAMAVPQSVLSSWLNGKSLPSRKNEYRIAEYLGVPLADIQALIRRSDTSLMGKPTGARTHEAGEPGLPSEVEDILAGLARDAYIRPPASRIIRVIVLDEYRRHREGTGD